MIRLVRAEVRRLLARRLLRVLGAVLLAGLAFAAVNTALHSNRDLSAARAKAEQQSKQYAAQSAENVKMCEADQAAGRIPPEVTCESEPGGGPTAENFYVDPRYRFAHSAPNAVSGVIVGVGMLGVVLGASAIGAEWSAGTFAALLTWEPRRLRVLAAKLVGLVGVVVVIAVAAVAIQLLASWVIAGTRGTLAGTTTHLVGGLLWQGARATGLVALLTAAAAGTAGILRSTAGALGAGAGYMVFFEILSRNLRPGWARWLLSSNAGALVTGKLSIYPPASSSGIGTGPADPVTAPRIFVLHASRAALVLFLGTAAVVAMWGLLLRRRDVT